MLVEFIGISGSGKTTVSIAVEKLLMAKALPCGGLRNLAIAAQRAQAGGIAFVKRRPERTSLFGAMSFRETEPRIFDLLCSQQGGASGQTMWNMEMLSQLWFAREAVAGPDYVLADEGYLHRGCDYLISDESLLREFIELVTGKFLTVAVDLDEDVALSRLKGRVKGIPKKLKGQKDMETLSALSRQKARVALAVGLNRDFGGAVLSVDGARPVSEIAQVVVDWITGC